MLFDVDFVKAIQAGPGTPEAIVQVFDKCKVEAKANFKRIAFEQHPDRGGDLEKFQELTEIWNRLQDLTIKLRPRLPVTTIQFHVVISPHTGPISTTTSSFTSGTGSPW